MANGKEVSVFEVVGSSCCIDPDDGEKVYKLASVEISAERPVTLCFQRVLLLTTSFLHVAVGRLYNGKLDWEKVDSLLKYKHLSPDDMTMWDDVIDNAKQFYTDRRKYRESVQKADQS